MEREEPMRCPACGSRDIRLSLARGIADAVLASVGQAPYRCRSCRRRFYRRARKSAHSSSAG